MKKKLLALLLVLALTLALMLPAFAAVGSTASTHACNHNWAFCGAAYISGYAFANRNQHYVYYSAPQICTICAAQVTNVVNTALEGHQLDGSGYCVRCGVRPSDFNSIGDVLI